jgi:hypothetical protein
MRLRKRIENLLSNFIQIATTEIKKLKKNSRKFLRLMRLFQTKINVPPTTDMVTPPLGQVDEVEAASMMLPISFSKYSGEEAPSEIFSVISLEETLEPRGLKGATTFDMI